MDTIKSVTFLVGCVVLAGGAGLVYMPAGVILAGVALLFISIALKGGDE